MSQSDAAAVQFARTDRASSRTSTPAHREQRSSYDAGDSRPPSITNTPAGTDSSTLAVPSPDRSSRSSPSRRQDAEAPTHPNGHHVAEARSPRAHKVRSGGGFLLQETIRDASANVGVQRGLSRQTPQSRRVKSSPRASEASGSSAGRDGPRISIDSPSQGSGVLSPSLSSPPNLTIRKRQAQGPEVVEEESPRKATNQSLDLDSAQIVNMALNLSESRRLASRRAASLAVPPTLAPVPDGGTGGALKQHLQQQRRTSRNISPVGKSPRLASGATMNSSPMHASFDTSRDTSFRYNFSPSTLLRAQKAKEHLELMAQYRRVLEMVPPLKPRTQRRPDTASQTGSPQNLSKSSTADSRYSQSAFGRPYNPLQYIRNRKVRARERKGIDGKAQGFGDVKKVTDWVDEVALWTATGQGASREGPSIPPYPEADAQAQQGSPSASAVKPKRPRVDWVIDPSDMLADIYWLDKDNHIQLIEDRHWRRIFPQTLEAHKPATQVERRSHEFPRPQDTILQTPSAKPNPAPADHNPIESEIQPSQGSARDRARQKLHDLKGFHRHSSLTHTHHDFLHRQKSSISAQSDSDEEARVRTGPRRTYTANSKDILEKQMLEMIAREAHEESGELMSSGPASVSALTPEGREPEAPEAMIQDDSRKTSLAEPSEPDDKPSMPKTRPPHTHVQQRYGRPSLEIPMPVRGGSLDLDPSVPNSPDAGDGPFVSKIGAELSPPPTRSNSPSRNPFHKVKTRIFRDKSRERGTDHSSDRHHEHESSTDSKATPVKILEPLQPSRRPSPDRGGSRSPPRKPLADGSELQRSHTKHKSSESGVRGMLKGVRLDNVIKGGVSKIGDLIWRRESDAAEQAVQSESEMGQTEESDSEPSRGRHRPNLSLSRTASTTARDSDARHQQGKHYLDVMPVFQHASHDKLGSHSRAGSTTGLRLSRPPSRSSRFEKLKPPRIDVHPSPSLSTSPMQRDLKEYMKGQEMAQRADDADDRFKPLPPLAPPFDTKGRRGSLAASFDRRHWSISERDTSSPFPAPVSRREVARLRALVLSSGIMAMEIARRANEPRPVFAASSGTIGTSSKAGAFWPSIAPLSAEPSAVREALVPQSRQYQFAAQALSGSVEASIKRWQAAADEFANEAAPGLQARVEDLRRHIAVDLSAMTRAAADEADETSRDLDYGQRLKTKQVVDTIEKMLRRRRRRFRWVRRGLWLGVEWVVVGFMWYVWFVVTIMNIFLGMGKGVWRGVRWLLWL